MTKRSGGERGRDRDRCVCGHIHAFCVSLRVSRGGENALRARMYGQRMRGVPECELWE